MTRYLIVSDLHPELYPRSSERPVSGDELASLRAPGIPTFERELEETGRWSAAEAEALLALAQADLCEDGRSTRPHDASTRPPPKASRSGVRLRRTR